MENGQKKAKDSRQALPCLLRVVDVTCVQGALVASGLTQSLVELELNDKANEVPGVEGGEAWGGVAGDLCPSPSSADRHPLVCRVSKVPQFHAFPPPPRPPPLLRGSLYISGRLF